MTATRPIASTCVLVLASLAVAFPLGAEPANEYRSFRSTAESIDPATQPPPKGMTLIPGGSAVIGISQDEIKALGTENPHTIATLLAASPKHTVQVEPFYLDTYEVTNAQWKAFLDATGRKPSEDLVKLVWLDGNMPAGSENAAVSAVSYHEVVAYCRWIMKRLPTEVEWEYAARGPEGLRYPWGNEYDRTRAVGLEGKFEGGKRQPQKVGSRPEGVSPFGVHDLAGNVWEWTSSPMEAYPGYATMKMATRFNKKGEEFSAKDILLDGHYVARGGAYDNDELGLLACSRAPMPKDGWMNVLGFRCAKGVRPGQDAVEYAIGDMVAMLARTPIDVKQVQAVEVTNFDEAGLPKGAQFVAFAPVGEWERFKEVQEEAAQRPVVAGVFAISEPLLRPELPAGTYAVAYSAANRKIKSPGAAKEDGWVHPGNPIETGAASASASEKAAPEPEAEAPEADGEAAEGEAGGDGATAEGESGEDEARVEIAIAGATLYDRSIDNLVIVNRHGTVLAALPLTEKVKDGARFEPATLKREIVRKSARAPEMERFTFAFVVQMPSRRAAGFELPLFLDPVTFKAP